VAVECLIKYIKLVAKRTIPRDFVNSSVYNAFLVSAFQQRHTNRENEIGSFHDVEFAETEFQLHDVPDTNKKGWLWQKNNSVVNKLSVTV